MSVPLRQSPGIDGRDWVTPPQIRMVHRNGPPEAALCPFFLCTVCHAPVYSVPSPEHPLKGYVIHYEAWDWEAEPPREWLEQIGPFVVHRYDCMAQLEVFIKQAYGDRFTGPLSDDLETVLRQLTYNTSHPISIRDEPNAEYVAPPPSDWRTGHYERERRG